MFFIHWHRDFCVTRCFVRLLLNNKKHFCKLPLCKLNLKCNSALGIRPTRHDNSAHLLRPTNSVYQLGPGKRPGVCFWAGRYKLELSCHFWLFLFVALRFSFGSLPSLRRRKVVQTEETRDQTWRPTGWKTLTSNANSVLKGTPT